MYVNQYCEIGVDFYYIHHLSVSVQVKQSTLVVNFQFSHLTRDTIINDETKKNKSYYFRGTYKIV